MVGERGRRLKLKKMFRNPYLLLELPDMERDKCFYCGEYAYETDHVPPITHLGDFNLGFLIPTCRECNVILSNKRYFTLRERVCEIKNRLKIRYNYQLKISPWCNNELNELDGRLKEYVANHTNAVNVLLERIKYYSSMYELYSELDLYSLNIESGYKKDYFSVEDAKYNLSIDRVF